MEQEFIKPYEQEDAQKTPRQADVIDLPKIVVSSV